MIVTRKSRFYRTIAVVLVYLMIFQGLPLAELSRDSSTNEVTEFLNRLFEFLGPRSAHAAAPVADAGEDQIVTKTKLLEAEVILNGTGSSDPEGDPLIHNWFGPLSAPTGPTPSMYIQEGRYTVSLVVSECTASSELDTAVFTVIPCFDLSARSKRGKVQLTWPHQTGAVQYEVYRAVESDPFNFVKIGDTASTYSTYLDPTVANDTTYLYAVKAFFTDSSCYSQITSSHPPAARSRSRMNYAPVIYSPPVTRGTVGIPFNYDVLATDPNGNSLSYNLLNGPAGMTMGPAGLLSWTPAAAGLFDVTVAVGDGSGGSDTQSFSIQVELPVPAKVNVTVPGVTGLPRADAEAAIVAAGLTVGAVSTANSDTVTAGSVISQDPAAVNSVDNCSPIDIVVSLGPPLVIVPDVVNLPQADAEAAIVAAELTLGQIDSQYSDTVAVGSVINQEPAGGSEAIKGSAVDIVVSLGPPLVTVPDVIGLQQAEAEAAIVASDLTVGAVTTVNNDTVPAGSVIIQDPAGGTEVIKGSAVDILVSLGPPLVIVPDVVGQTQAAAEAAITATYLTVGAVTKVNSDTVPTGSVIIQNPAGGSVVIKGSEVDIMLSLGPPLVIVPDVVGMSQTDAEVAIATASLNMGQVGIQYSDTVPKEYVISQAPVTGSRVVEGSAIDIVVSLGPDPINVPDVVGLPEADANTTLAATGLVIGNVTADYSDTVPSGTVISQTPLAGTSVPRGSSVHLVISLGPADIDLTPGQINVTNLSVDSQSLILFGTVIVEISNKGSSAVAGRYEVMLFEDSNLNRTYDTGDTVLGTTALSAAPEGGGSTEASISVNGNVLFKDNPIFAFVDSNNDIEETDEDNNLLDSIADCESRPPVGNFDPVVKFQALNGINITATPMVVNLTDDDGDGLINENDIPDIVFPTTQFGASFGNLIKAISGDDGHEIFTTDRRDLAPHSEVAIADIDGDKLPEIVAPQFGGQRLIAFEHTGELKWISSARQVLGTRQTVGAVSIANLDQTGPPEIILGATVYSADGGVLGDGRQLGGTAGLKTTAIGAAISVVADVDLDGRPEIIAGPSAYRLENGALTLVWRRNDLTDGFAGIANLDDDPFAEIVITGSGQVYVLNHDGSNAEIWNPPNGDPLQLPGGGAGGAPTIADYDGDGIPEIGVAGSRRYVVFERDGTILWFSSIQDTSSNMTGSTPFDFEGDGSVEIVYCDQKFLRIYRGSDGFVLFSMPMRSGTITELPVVADVDNDGNAEIVVCSDTRLGGDPDLSGIYVIEDANDTWVNTRTIWNQHSYHITNIEDDGTVPLIEANNWEQFNNYRQNQLLKPFGCVDLTAFLIRINNSGCPASVDITGRIGNGGALHVAKDTSVAFYQGTPESGGTLLGATQLSARLNGGRYEDVTFTWNDPQPRLHSIYVTADEDGTGTGKVREVDEDNNTATATLNICIDPPEITSTPPVTINVGQTYSYDVDATDSGVGGELTFILDVSPDEMTIDSASGLIQWTPTGDETGSQDVTVRVEDENSLSDSQSFTITVNGPPSNYLRTCCHSLGLRSLSLRCRCCRSQPG